MYRIIFLTCLIFIACNKHLAEYDSQQTNAMTNKDEYQHFELENNVELNEFLNNQNKIYQEYIDSSLVKKLYSEILEEYNNDLTSINSVRITNGGEVYYLKKTIDDTKHEVFYRSDFDSKEEKITIVIPEDYDDIIYIKPSWNGDILALVLVKKGEEIGDIYFYNCITNTLLDIQLKNSWPNALGGIEWLPSNDAILYTYIPEIKADNEYYRLKSELRLHRLDDDHHTILMSKEKNLNIPIDETAYPIGYIENHKSNVIICSIASTERYRDTYFGIISDDYQIKWNLLFRKEDKTRGFQIVDNTIYIRSEKDHNNFGLYAIDLDKNNAFVERRVIVEPDDEWAISDFIVADHNNLYISYTKNGIESKLVNIKDLVVTVMKLDQAVGGISLSMDITDLSTIWYTTQSWVSNSRRYALDIKSNISKPADLRNYISDPNDYVVEEIEVISRDGEYIPLSLIYNKDIQPNSNSPLMITAYGAYGYTYKPFRSAYLDSWYKRGGVYAVAHVRGGGEKGEKWRLGGYKHTKLNSWNDLIDCTNYLHKISYSSSDKTIVIGSSAGGVTVGGAITSQPELFNAAILQVSILNPSRMVLYPSGRAGLAEFGDPNKADELMALKDMDPYRRIFSDVHYPNTLILSGTKDVRVPHWQSAKFAAKLLKNSENQVLLKTDYNKGHGFHNDPSSIIMKQAEILSFALKNTSQ